MKRYCGTIAALAVSLLILPACKKRTEALKSDLGEAGYKLTAGDWFRASAENDVAALKKFAAANFPVDTVNPAGDSALHVAAAAGARGSADYLLNRGLTVDLRGAEGRTPLMDAILADQTETVRWLLRQGADPRLKDKDGFKPLLLAVREGKAGSVAELAPYDRGDLDSALLLAALVGRTDVIDALTNFGASVYARMEDGRTPLMVAAENGHAEAVKLLMDIGASRFTTDPEGRTAVDIAIAAGHSEIATLISRPLSPTDLTLDSPVEIASSMDAYVDAANEKAMPAMAHQTTHVAKVGGAKSISIDAQTVSRAVARGSAGSTAAGDPPPVADGDAAFPMPPLVMRHYREKEVPVSIRTVQGDTATVRIAGKSSRDVKVKAGDSIPGTKLVVMRVQRRMEDSKVNLGAPSEISIVKVRDNSTGNTRDWVSGVPSNAHDPVALLEDSASGKRYVVSPGQSFKDAGGGEYVISEVRPNQVVIQEKASGTVRTIPLRGPRG